MLEQRQHTGAMTTERESADSPNGRAEGRQDFAPRRRRDDLVETRTMLDLVRFLMVRPTVDQIAQHLVLRLFASFQPRGVLISLCAPDGTLHLAGSFGFAPGVVTPFEHLSLWEASPLSESVRSGDPLIIGSAEEMERRYPWLVSDTMPAAPLAAWPLNLPNERVGVIEVIFGKDPDIEALQRELGGIAAVLALYLSLVGSHGMEVKNRETPATVTTLPERESGSSVSRPAQLSERQMQILALMASGLTNTQIALRVGYSESTVRQETMAIYRYFGVNGRRDAVRIATMRGMLQGEGSLATRPEASSAS